MIYYYYNKTPVKDTFLSMNNTLMFPLAIRDCSLSLSLYIPVLGMGIVLIIVICVLSSIIHDYPKTPKLYEFLALSSVVGCMMLCVLLMVAFYLLIQQQVYMENLSLTVNNLAKSLQV